jgi:hypothetical protein
MAYISRSSVAEILATDYGNETFLPPHERFMAKFYNACEDFEDGGALVGTQRTFEIPTADSHAAAGVPEGGDLPTFNVPDQINASVAAVQLATTVAWSDLMLSIGRAQGLVTKVDIIDRYVKMTVRNFYSALNRWSLGHGTGRMAVVASTTDTSTTVPCRNPESTYQLRRGMVVGFYDLDTGGTLQGATQTITDINHEAGTFTIDAARTLTAGWGVYKARGANLTEYGLASNGLRGFADNGELTATCQGVTRASESAINAHVINGAGGTLAFSEKLVRKAVNKITGSIEQEPDEIWCNVGIISEYLNGLTGARVFQVTGDGVPSYQIGAKQEALAFHTSAGRIPFKVDRDLPNGEFILLIREFFRRHVARKASWIGDDTGADGSSAPVLMQAPGGTNTYALQKLAGMLWIGNLANLQPKGLCRVTRVQDEELAGDTPVAA